MKRVNEINIEAYDRVAKEFKKTHFKRTYWKSEFKEFCSLVPGKKVIEIGCGPGRDAKLFAKEKFEYIGTDASKGMIREAHKTVKNAKFKVMDYYDLDFPAQTFDGFWAVASILHVPKRRIRKVLRSIKRVLKPGGVGFITIKEKRSLDEGVIHDDRYGGVDRFFAFYAQVEFQKILEETGFSVISAHKVLESNPPTVWLCYFVSRH